MPERNVLPDSRLKDPKGTVMVDWPMEDGTSIRIELEGIWCFNCGRACGYVPRGIMSFVSWLCQPCSDKWGGEASLHVSSDAEFWAKVGEEMLTVYGRALTQQELWELAQQDKLSSGLELLIRESPFKTE